MRIRSIKPEFWTSEDVAALDWYIAYQGRLLETASEWRAAAPQCANASYVYLLFSGDQLLYVGKAATVLYRIERHRSRKQWWAQVDYVALVRVHGRDYVIADQNALSFEKAAINRLLPTQNLAGPQNLPARLALAVA